MKRKVDITMRTSTIKYFVAESLKSLKRNRTLSIASIATVMATLFIFGVFLLSAISVDTLVDQLGSNLQADIYLKDEITQPQLEAIKVKLSSVQGIKNIEFEDKAAALENAKKRFGGEGEEMVRGLEESNPFPMAFVVTVDKPEYITQVVDKVKGMEGIQEIRDVRDIASKIQRYTDALRLVGMVMFIILVIVSIFLIGNTIKLAVFSRRREIGIMKFVGATDWFIRWPFILEGMFIGFIGSVFASGILYYVYKIFVYSRLMNNMFVKLISPTYVLVGMTWKFIIAGAIIGAIGSIISVRKYLKV
ncbi:permease-like cell division protein FtsX [Hathewaya limosa]|uniref:Cell division protein FtsX n=1 Tax=Hathewaya limosa TaxID=1536 RepID=A0ABU0JWU7_HATLI|nr:permease-like cell division protein FtsX [Hathewaya limosa]MDQ0480731.1 cell division transport system permease protein [Hathewaya limosa]